MIYLIIWIFMGIVGALIASSKGNGGCGGFALGLLLGPIGILIALVSLNNERENRRRRGDTRKCPSCAEYVKEDAIVCRHCSRSLSGNPDFDIETFRR